jgi:plastocyanin
MANRPIANHAGGISVIAFVVAVAVSIGYYQWLYIPQVNAKPILPDNILNPTQTTQVTIVEGAVLQTQANHFVPKDARGVIGLSNKVMWTNKDSTPHTVTSDDPQYVDKINGPFDSLQQQDKIPGGFILPGKTFEFTFTATGTYSYHCSPHPWMQGKVDIVENFA